MPQMLSVVTPEPRSPVLPFSSVLEQKSPQNISYMPSMPNVVTPEPQSPIRLIL